MNERNATIGGNGRGDHGEVWDALGVGFGPANMALAIAMEEEAEAPGGRDLRRVFLEARTAHSWHPGMLLDNALLQITVLKDLATVRNPCSRFTFLNYLKEKGRLYEFLNLRDLFPSRVEFNDYLGWVSRELRHRVRAGKRVVAVAPVLGPRDGEVSLLKVTAEDAATGAAEEHLTRALVLATGGVPCFPPGVEVAGDGRAFHSQDFLPRLARDFPDREAPYRFVVVGAGQSGAEVFHHLLVNYPNADVTAAVRRFGYKPVDDSDFTNEVFFPEMVDLIHALPEGKRRRFTEGFRDVNYAVVDAPLIRRIYRCLYEEKVRGRARARVRPFLELRALCEEPGAVAAEFHDLLHDRPVRLPADGVVLATGYRWPRNHPLLEGLAPWLLREEGGAYRIERDYGVAAAPAFAPRVFLQGFCEETHGISETVLSLLPVRAGDVLASLLAAVPRSTDARQAPPAVLLADGELALWSALIAPGETTR